MRIKDLLEDLRMGFAELSQVVGDTMRIGFEAETVLRIPSDMTISDAIDALVNTIEPVLGIRFFRTGFKYDNYHSDHYAKELRDYSVWHLENDSSIYDVDTDGNVIDSRHTNDWYGMEFVSPVMEISEFFDIVPRLFKFFDDYGIETNITTGFHVSLSFKDKSKLSQFDPLKVMIFMGEQYIADQFKRAERTAKNNIAQRIASLRKIIYKGKESYNDDIRNIISQPNFTDVVTSISKLMSQQVNVDGHISVDGRGSKKSFTVAFHRLATQGYVEFRIIGGNDYHHKFDTITKTVQRFIRLMDIGSNPDLYKREYYTKIAKLLVSPGETDNDIELCLQSNQRLLAHFYKIESGYDYEVDENSSTIHSPESVAWRMIDFIDDGLYSNKLLMDKPTVKRRIKLICNKYNISDAILISTINGKDSPQVDRKKIALYFGITKLPRRKPRPDNDYY